MNDRLNDKLEELRAKNRSAQLKDAFGSVLNDGLISMSSPDIATRIRLAVLEGLRSKSLQQCEFNSFVEMTHVARNRLDNWPSEEVGVGALADGSRVAMAICSKASVIAKLEALFDMLGKNMILVELSEYEFLVLEYDHFSTGDSYTASFSK